MKRLLFLFFLFLFLVPFSASAESGKPYTRYCPDPKEIFTGIAHDEAGNPKLSLAVDPAFNAKMKAERNTPDLPVTPIYDLVVTAVPTINEYCLPQYDENGTLIKKVDPPKTLPFTVSLELAGKALISGSLSWNSKRDEDGSPVYELKITGWPNGILSESKMERLIRAVHDRDPSIKLAVQMKFKDGTNTRAERSADFTLCAPVWGSGQHHTVYVRVAHRLSDFIYQAKSVISDGFLKVDPFRAYQKEFSHVLNLLDYKGTPWSEIQDSAEEGTLPLFSDCGNGVNIAISPLVSKGDFAAAIQGGKFIYAASDVTWRFLELNKQVVSHFAVPLPFPLIVLHEFGHAFAGLNDEYVKGIIAPAKAFTRNCSTNPASDWSYRGIQYGDASFEGCTTPSIHRPSQASIMRGAQSGETRFNVVSCGYIVAAIKGVNGPGLYGPEYFQECMNPQWNTIKPTGKTVSFGLQLASIFQAMSFVPSPAAVGEAQLRAGTPVKVIVPDTRTPPAEFEALASGEKTAKPEICLDPSGKQSFADNPQPFRASWEKEAKCAQGIADATVLQQKVSDLKASILVIQNFIDSLSLSVEETKNMNSLDGASFFITPEGQQQEKAYGRADSIALQCVSGVTVSIGASGASKGSIYVGLSPALATQTEAVKQKILKSYVAYRKEPTKDRGTVINSTLNRLTALQETLNGNFILVTANALSKYHQAVMSAGVAIPLSVKLELGADGKEKKCAIGGWANAQLKVGGRDVLASGDFLSSTISFNGHIFEHDCIPQAYLLKVLKAGVLKNLAYFEKQKVEYEALLKPLEQQLQVLTNAGYSCANPVVVASGGTPVRKSIIPPPSAAVQGESEGGQNIYIEHMSEDGTLTGEVLMVPTISYFPPPLVEIAPDDAATSTVSATSTPLLGSEVSTSTATSTEPFAVGATSTATTTLLATTTLSFWDHIRSGFGAITDAVVSFFGGGFATSTSGTATTPPFATTTPRIASTTAAVLSRYDLLVSKPVLSGSSAGAGKFFAGPVTLQSVIANESDTVLPTFSSVWEYSTDENVWNELVRFDVPELGVKGEATVTYSWTVNPGIWFFRACAKEICSEPLRVEIVAKAGAPAVPTPSSGRPRLFSNRPTVSGRQAGFGKLYAGSMTFSGKVKNIGDGESRAFKALLQYSQDDLNWQDWVQIDLPPLGPGATSKVDYSWNGGEGVWYVRACDDITDTCSASTKFEVVPI